MGSNGDLGPTGQERDSRQGLNLPGALERCHMPGDQAARVRAGRHENWLAILEAYGVQYLVLDIHRDRDLLQLVRSRPGWTVDFKEGETVLFARTQTLYDARAAA